jgi:hypothetical protein
MTSFDQPQVRKDLTDSVLIALANLEATAFCDLKAYGHMTNELSNLKIMRAG